MAQAYSRRISDKIEDLLRGFCYRANLWVNRLVTSRAGLDLQVVGLQELPARQAGRREEDAGSPIWPRLTPDPHRQKATSVVSV
jgi:hypothetical protein